MFADRTDAGRQLAEALARKDYDDPVLLALPRGGVPIAAIVAERLDCPLDLVLVRKIGAPGQEELAVAAVADGPHRHVAVNDDVMRLLGLDRRWVEARADDQMAEIRRRRQAYLGNRAPVPVKGRTAIVVDDGIATGATTQVALEAVREAAPARLVLAVPVAPPETVDRLRQSCDEVVCLETPSQFGAIGTFYEDFHQVSDQEVVAALDRAAARTSQSTDRRPGTAARDQPDSDA